MPDVSVTITTGTPVTVRASAPTTVELGIESAPDVTIMQAAPAAANVAIGTRDVNATVSNPDAEAVQTYAITKYCGTAGAGYTTLTANQLSGAAAVVFATNFKANTLSLFKNGILMEKDVEYSEAVARTGFTLLVAVDATDKIEARYVQI